MAAFVKKFLGLFNRRATPNDPLLERILANPADDVPRLEFADELAKSGDPDEVARAELIRFQIETARLPDGVEKSKRIERAVAIFNQHKSRWYGWIRNADNVPCPVRGFIESWFYGSGGTHDADFAAAIRREPITELTLAPAENQLHGIGSLPFLQHVQTLKLWGGTNVSEADVVALLSSPHLSSLSKFEYDGPGAILGRPRPDGIISFANAARVLADDPRFKNLQRISISGAQVADEGARALGRSSVLTNLNMLGLGYCGIEGAGMHELLASPIVAGVQTLGLAGNAFTEETGQDLVAALADSACLGRLSRLILDDTAITDRAAVRLAAAKLPPLECLYLLPRNVNNSESSVTLPTMSVAGLESLLSSTWFHSLEELNLSSHPLGDAGARALASARLPRLRRLDLMQIGLTAAGLRTLVEAYSNQLVNLQLFGNPLGDAAADSIASASWPRMTVPQPGLSIYDIGIFLGGCGIGPKGLNVLRDSQTLADVPNVFVGSG